MKLKSLEKKFYRHPRKYFLPLANAYREHNKLDECIRILRDGLSMLPYYWAAKVALGRALFEKGDFDGAFEELQIAVAYIPENLLLHQLLSSLYLKKEDVKKASFHCQLVLFIDPFNVECLGIKEEISKLHHREEISKLHHRESQCALPQETDTDNLKIHQAEDSQLTSKRVTEFICTLEKREYDTEMPEIASKKMDDQFPVLGVPEADEPTRLENEGDEQEVEYPENIQDSITEDISTEDNIFTLIEGESSERHEHDDRERLFSQIENFINSNRPDVHKARDEVVIEVVKYRDNDMIDVCFLNKKEKYYHVGEQVHFCLAENKNTETCYFFFNDQFTGEVYLNDIFKININKLCIQENLYDKKEKIYRYVLPKKGIVILSDGYHGYFLRMSIPG